MGKLFVVSDVHGYMADLKDELGRVGLVDGSGRWTGNDDQLWVLGDLMDRGPDGIGVVDFMMSLEQQAPEQVHVLMGNHESLALGAMLFPGTRFENVWAANGAKLGDQQGLTEHHLDWFRGLPVVARAGEHLLMHSDTTSYLEWGDSVEAINSHVASVLAGDDYDSHWAVFYELSSRYHFVRDGGTELAKGMLRRLGATSLVHGHSIIGSLVDRPSRQVTEPWSYADGLALAIDGGRYDNGPLLLVRLD